MESIEATTPKYMVYCVMVASLTSLSLGWIMGSPNVPGEVTHNCPTGNARIFSFSFPDCLPMTTYGWAFAVASFGIGGFFGGIGSVYFQSKVGRKRTIMLSNAGFVIGSVIIALSISPAMFIIGRIIVGLSCGMCTMVIPTYIGEISTIRARGAMGCFHPLFIALGIFLTTLIGMFLAYVPYWRLCYALAGLPSLIQMILMISCAESPRWLISMNQIEKARHALQQLRGSADVDREFFEMIQGQVGATAAGSVSSHPMALDDTDDEGENIPVEPGEEGMVYRRPMEQQMTLRALARDPVLRRMTMTLLSIHALQQFMGMSAIVYYSTMVFSITFSQARLVAILATLDTIVNMLMTVAAVALIDRMGRRKLLMISEAGTALFSVVTFLGLFFHQPILLTVGLLCYVAVYSLGMGPIPWILTIDMCPTYASTTIGGLATCLHWIINFVMAFFFPIVLGAIQGFTFLIFAGVSLAALVFTYLYVPETKNRSIESVVREYESRCR
ncbi:general substrate transporter [Hesseltinella vesiculosa]|uniref:General substrate transporter n=1 Tax=Hesseltinella vesiculosa TaxID=101127 RepID=A0A1X2GG32_9FUNG|nr:general substrate transporter [Hesseltinella vesiculosa]